MNITQIFDLTNEIITKKPGLVSKITRVIKINRQNIIRMRLKLPIYYNTEETDHLSEGGIDADLSKCEIR
jgi:hypothetical protein